MRAAANPRASIAPMRAQPEIRISSLRNAGERRRLDQDGSWRSPTGTEHAGDSIEAHPGSVLSKILVELNQRVYRERRKAG
jgi:hypothetical protein